MARKTVPRGEHCPRCDQVHARCAGHKRRATGSTEPLQPCGRWPTTGLEVCAYHGARTPNAAAAGERRQAHDRALVQVGQLVDELGIDPKHPLEGLLEAVDRAGAMVGPLGELVRGLHVQHGDQPATNAKPAGDGEGTPTAPALLHDGDRAHILVTLYGEWLDRYGRLCKLALEAGVDERRVQMAEAQAERLFGAVTRALVRAKVPAEHVEAFRVSLAAELRALAA